MLLDIQLGKDENILQKHKFDYSIPQFFLKTHFWLTNKRVIVNAPTDLILGIINQGNETITYPLKQIAGIRNKKKYSYLFVILTGFCLVSTIGALFSLNMGAIITGLFWTSVMAACSYKTSICITTTSGTEVIRYSYVPWQTVNAKKLTKEINKIITEI